MCLLIHTSSVGLYGQREETDETLYNVAVDEALPISSFSLSPFTQNGSQKYILYVYAYIPPPFLYRVDTQCVCVCVCVYKCSVYINTVKKERIRNDTYAGVLLLHIRKGVATQKECISAPSRIFQPLSWSRRFSSFSCLLLFSHQIVLNIRVCCFSLSTLSEVLFLLELYSHSLFGKWQRYSSGWLTIGTHLNYPLNHETTCSDYW